MAGLTNRDLVFLLLGLVLGLLGAAAWLRARYGARSVELLRERDGARAAEHEAREALRAAGQDTRRLTEELVAERDLRARAETRLEEARASLENQKRQLDEATRRLSDTFGALSSEALKSNNQAFLDLAAKTFEKIVSDQKGDLSKRQEAIAALVKPLSDGLNRYETGLREIEKARGEAYGSLRRHLTDLASQQQALERETRNLAAGLRNPQVRGRWGEITLRRVVETAGMSEHCDFTEQGAVTGEQGRQRPDMIVHLPGGRTVVVDAKVPLSAYLAATETDLSEEAQRAKLQEHAQSLRTHMMQLSTKQYWSQFKPSPDFVVLFVPAESIFSAALRVDRSLIEEGFRRRVVLATPTTLIALLRVVAYGWNEARMADNARRIAETGSDLFDRIRSFLSHLDKVRDGLRRAGDAYNSAVGSLERRVLPGTRRLKELGAATTGRELPDMNRLEQPLRELPAADDDASGGP